MTSSLEMMAVTRCLIVGAIFVRGWGWWWGGLHAWTEKNVLEMSSASFSVSQICSSEEYATLARLKLGSEQIQNRSGLKTRPQRVLSVLPASTRPSARPSVTRSLVCKAERGSEEQVL